jgi:Zn-dependent M32 family carboxypeptidase
VRIATRVNENDVGDAIFSTLHEAGHAMYEQGVNVTLDGSPLGKGVSAGVHESQSRELNSGGPLSFSTAAGILCKAGGSRR